MANELQAAVAACVAVADRGKIPILRTIRMISNGSMVELCATDTAQTILARVACDGAADMCVDAEALAIKVKTLRGGEVSLDHDDKVLTLLSGRTKWSTPILPTSDFTASLAKRVEGKTTTLPATFIADAQRVHGHADDKIEMCMGVCVDGGRLIATTGKTMGVVGGMEDTGMRITLPTSAVNRLSLLSGHDLKLTASKRMAMFEGDHLTLITRLQETAFPDWKRVIPTLPHSVIVDRAELIGAMSRASAIRTDEKTGFIGMTLTIGEDEILVRAGNAIGERGDDGCRHAGREGPEMQFGFSKYRLMIGLDAMPAETLRIRYGSDNKMQPVIFESAVGGREDFSIVLPYALKGEFAE